jgi:magnesium transporter
MPGMLKAIHCDTREHVFRHVTSVEQASERSQSQNAIVWLDVESPTEQELAKLGQAFKLHPLAIEDASHEHQRPKVEEYEGNEFCEYPRIEVAIWLLWGFDIYGCHLLPASSLL